MRLIRHLAPAYEPGLARIVLVDQEQDFVDRTSSLLNAEGFLCRGFTSLESAAESVAIQSPDVLLAGVNQPGVSSQEIARRVRENSLLANLPVIFLSTTQVPDIIHRCDEGHGSYSIRKTLEIGVLVELIEKMLPAAIAACPH
jgi:DNA-binding response OmpR family regulator